MAKAPTGCLLGMTRARQQDTWNRNIQPVVSFSNVDSCYFVTRFSLGVDDKNVQVFESGAAEAGDFPMNAEYELTVSVYLTSTNSSYSATYFSEIYPDTYSSCFIT